MKIVYFFDKKTKELASSEIVENDIEIPENATFIKPEPGLYQPITFDGEKWVGISEEEFNQGGSNLMTEPTPEQIGMTALAQGCSNSLAKIKTLEEATTDLAKNYSSALKHISSLEQSLTELTKEKSGGIEDDGNENSL